MNRLYILLAVMVVMVAAPLFVAHEALAVDRLGTAEGEALTGSEEMDYINGRGGDDYLYALGGDDLIYARDTASYDYIDCGGGFDQVETIHRDDVTLSNCERALGPRAGNIPTG